MAFLQLGISRFVQMGNSSFVHLSFQMADLFDRWESVRLVGWHGIPGCAVEDKQGKSKDHGQDKRVSNDFGPGRRNVGRFGISVLEKIGDGGEILSLFHAFGNGGFGFGFFLGCHDDGLSNLVSVVDL